MKKKIIVNVAISIMTAIIANKRAKMVAAQIKQQSRRMESVLR